MEHSRDEPAASQGVKTIWAAVTSDGCGATISYSVEELWTFRDVPLSSGWPSFLDGNFKNKRGNWDPESWHHSRKPAAAHEGPEKHHSKPPKEDDRPNSSLSNDSKKASKDPKERIKVEQQECLVLGPRRGSFNTGCQVSQSTTTEGTKGGGSERAKEIREMKERVASSRRVGSGRILAREEQQHGGFRDRRRGATGDQENEDRPPWFDRWSNNKGAKDDQRGGSRNNGTRSGSRFHRRSDMVSEEPEWMTEAVCQDDVMELRGFDDSPGKEAKREEDKTGGRDDNEAKVKAEGLSMLDDILHLDSIPGLANILADDGLHDDRKKKEGSRFSQFFQKSNRSPQGGDKPIIRIPSPGDPSAYFAPISPAAQTTTSSEEKQQQQQSNTLMDMLRGKAAAAGGVDGFPSGPSISQLVEGKGAKSVEELEAGMKEVRNGGGMKKRPSPSADIVIQQPKKEVEDEMSAFKEFAAVMLHKDGESDVGSNNQPPPMGLVRPAPLQVNSRMTEQDLLSRMQNGPPQPPPQRPMFPMPGPPPHESQINRDILSLIRQQPFNPDVLRRPEAMSLTACLEQNKVTPQLLLHQFIHGTLTPYHREILLNILKVAQSNGLLNEPSPRTSPLPPPPPDPLMMLLQQQQQGGGGGGGGNTLSVSPNQQQRVPSPQELMIHTQQIMQNALIRRKLEEQKESYRKRMEMSSKGDGHSSGSPLAFTPTVVMKKMAAERRDSTDNDRIGPRGDEGSNRVSPGGQQLIEQFAQRSQQMPPLPPPMAMVQAAQMQQQLATLHHHRFNAPPPHPMVQQHPFVGLPHQFPSHLGPRPQQQQGGGASNRVPSPSNQGLSRFFSPEVLAQAQSGDAPSMPPLPTQQAMTLEEIERKAAAVRI